MWIDKFERWDVWSRQHRARVCADEVAAHGDVLMFKQKTSKGRESTAAAFNRLAEGIAALAFQPGGVVFAGHHWCVGSGHSGIQVDYSGACDAEVVRDRSGVSVLPEPEPVRRARPIVDVHLPGESVGDLALFDVPDERAS
jgi:hypothetical protein